MSHLYNIKNILWWYISTILICRKRESSFITLTILIQMLQNKVKLKKESSEIRQINTILIEKNTWKRWIQWHSIILVTLHSMLQNCQATLHKSWFRCSHALNSLKNNINNSNWKLKNLINSMKSKKSLDNDWFKWMYILMHSSISSEWKMTKSC